MAGFRASEVWNAPSPGDVRTFHVTAGVTRVTAAQITNSSGGEIWLRQGSTPAKTADDADFIVPPRATGNYPLNTDQIAVTWNGAQRESADFIAFVFTDQPVVPAVYPGVAPIKFPDPISSPVQVKPGTAPFPYTLVTTSGKNIGSVNIYNPTHRTVGVYTAGGINDWTILPYSWRTIAVNQPSGNVVIWTDLAVPTDDSSENRIGVTWSDIDYTGPFPTGAGLTKDQTLHWDGVAGQWTAYVNVSTADRHYVGAALPRSRIAIDYGEAFVNALPTANALITLVVGIEYGFDGVGVSTVLGLRSFRVHSGGSLNGGFSILGGQPLIVSNLHSSRSNRLYLEVGTGGSPGDWSAQLSMRGWSVRTY